MAQRTQLKLNAITSSFGSSLGSINDNLTNKAALADINTIDLSGSLSFMASAIRRIHGGSDFSNQTSGEFTLDVIPSVTDAYSLGNDSKAWRNLNLVSGSIQSITAPGTNTEESLAIIADPGTSLVFSSSLDGNTFSHNFQGVPLELDSLADTIGEYNGMKDQGGIPVALYNINGTLYWGNNVLNGDYVQFKDVTRLTSAVSAGDPLSNSNFTTISVSDIPIANREKAIEVYLNGALLQSGSSAQVAANEVDYFLDDSTASAADIKFSFDVEIDDNVTVLAKYAKNVAQSPITTQIADTDGDTKIQVEESTNENIIRFDTAGNERMLIRNDGRVAIGANIAGSLPNAALIVDGSGIGGSVGDLAIASKMVHRGDPDTFFEFTDLNQINIEAGGENMIKMFGAPPNNRVLILSGGAVSSPDEEDYPDLNFFVSGSMGSMGTSTRGTAVFGGDMVISGSLADTKILGTLALSCKNIDGSDREDPAGLPPLQDHAHIYSKLISGNAEIFVQDSASNETQISPHNTEGEWQYFSRNRRTGKVVRVNMEKMIRKLEEFTGESFMEVWYEDPTD